MGEAKRRKNLDPGFGQSSPTVELGFSRITGKFLVEIKHRREARTVSPHLTIEGARHGIEMCQKCLDTFSAEELSGRIDTWFSLFIQRLIKYFDYDDDDEILAIGRLIDNQILLDRRRSVLNEATASINMTSIKKTGKKMFT